MVGIALMVGLLDMLGEDVSVGEVLGLNEGDTDGCRLIEGEEVGSTDTVGDWEMVGKADGDIDGLTEIEGNIVGCVDIVGDTDGRLVGIDDMEGEEVGYRDIVGDKVGSAVVGLSEGERVGESVGLSVGSTVGLSDGLGVGLGVGSELGSEVGLCVSVDPHKLPGGSVDVPHTVSCIQAYPVDTRENTPGIYPQPIPQLTMPTCTSPSGSSPRMIRGPPESP